MLVHRVQDKKWLIIPIETKARELRAKTLLACYAALDGWAVVLGGKYLTIKRQEMLPRGVVLHKSITPMDVKHIKRSKSLGNKVAAWCEEGLIYFDREFYRERRLSQEAFDNTDVFFTWGNRQLEDCKWALDRVNGKIINSGNPRVDLLRPEWRGIYSKKTEEIKKRYGNIILFNSNFSLYNQNLDVDWFDYMKTNKMISSDKELNREKKFIQYQTEVYHKFVTLVKKVALKYKKYRVVVRPHPSENIERLTTEFNGYDNIEVIFEHSANDWIMASEVLIHNNCTTGVEAFLLGKPVITYRPVINEEVESPLARDVGTITETIEETLEQLGLVLSGNSENAVYSEKRDVFINDYISSYSGDFSTIQIIKALNTLSLQTKSASFPVTLENIEKSKVAFKPIKKPEKNLISKLVIRVKSKFHKVLEINKPKEVQAIKAGNPDYSKQKFPGLDMIELEEVIREFSSHGSDFKKIKISTVGKDCFCLYTNP